ncbi:MAG: sugar ABC transporter permease [Lachnospiraceae bacterium]|nr:sugar ABC transporter permease [Lachnospiraceae bacterium]
MNKDKEEKVKKKKVKLSSYGRKMERKERVKGTLFLLPSISGVSVFYLIPFFVVLVYAFQDNPVTKNYVGLSNFIAIFKNEAFRLAAGNTLKFSLVAVPLAVIISLLMAILLDQSIPFASKFRTIFLSPMMVPIASVILVFRVLFDYNGAFNIIIRFFGASNIDWIKSEYAPFVIILLFLWKNLGYNMIMFLAALGTIPREMMEVAALDSNNALKLFFIVKIRYLSPTILFVTILSLINSFKIFREVYLLSGNYPHGSMYTLQHFMNNMFNSLDYQKLSSAAILMSIVMIVIILILYILENRFGKDMED